MRRFLAGALMCVACVACSTARSPGTATVSALGVQVTPSPGATPRVASLQCFGTPVGTGYLSAPEKSRAACAALFANEDLLAGGPPTNRVCTEIYGGPEKAVVSGRVHGRTINATFDRADGCGIADWDKLRDLLGPPEGGGSPSPA